MTSRPGPRPARRFRRRLGLRLRLSLLQGALALLICGGMATALWLVSSHVLLERNRAVATAHAASSAQALAGGLDQRGAAPPAQLLERISRPPGTLLVLWHKGVWSTTADHRLAGLHAPLADLARSAPPRTERIAVDGSEMRVVGVPLPKAAGYYFELSSTEDVDRALDILKFTLLGGSVAIALVAGALGWVAGNRALRPLAVVSEAAAAAVAGKPHARLDAEDDPDLGELARSFNSTTEALRQRVQADSRFAADVSHELRTPLTTMLNSMEVLAAQRDALPPRGQEAADLLDAELQRFQQLVLDLLEISKAENDQHPRLQPTRVADAVRMAADGAAGRPVTCVEPSAEKVQLDLDRPRVDRIIGNLVRNAELHGAGCTAVHVTARPDSVEIAVEDAGPGIPPERRTRVLERLVSTGSGPDGGSGLGLSIVQVHVRAHGGELRFEDRPGGGTRAVVTLPRGSRTEVLRTRERRS
jgi:signal transduction histidine kinase